MLPPLYTPDYLLGPITRFSPFENHVGVPTIIATQPTDSPIPFHWPAILFFLECNPPDGVPRFRIHLTTGMSPALTPTLGFEVPPPFLCVRCSPLGSRASLSLPVTGTTYPPGTLVNCIPNCEFFNDPLCDQSVPTSPTSEHRSYPINTSSPPDDPLPLFRPCNPNPASPLEYQNPLSSFRLKLTYLKPSINAHPVALESRLEPPTLCPPTPVCFSIMVSDLCRRHRVPNFMTQVLCGRSLSPPSVLFFVFLRSPPGFTIFPDAPLPFKFIVFKSTFVAYSCPL